MRMPCPFARRGPWRGVRFQLDTSSNVSLHTNSHHHLLLFCFRFCRRSFFPLERLLHLTQALKGRVPGVTPQGRCPGMRAQGEKLMKT